jgi:hypothetical protein
VVLPEHEVVKAITAPPLRSQPAAEPHHDRETKPTLTKPLLEKILEAAPSLVTVKVCGNQIMEFLKSHIRNSGLMGKMSVIN